MTILGAVEGASTPKALNDSFIPDNGVTPWVAEVGTSNRRNNESHPGVEASPSLNSVRGGKTSGGEEAEKLGGGPSTFHVRRCGSRITWSTAASDNGIGETRFMSDGPQRKTAEENESLKYAQGASLRLALNTAHIDSE